MKNAILNITVDDSGLGTHLGQIHFSVTSTMPLPPRALAVIQDILGYDPAGYSIFPAKQTMNDKTCTYSWSCSATAD